MSAIQDNLQVIRAQIAYACAYAGRSPSDVTLIAVTKTVSTPCILEALRAGVQHFGENRVQEALLKFHALRDTSLSDGDIEDDKISRRGITLHMIGSLQRNKARVAVSLFDAIHSVDRIELVKTLDREVEKAIARQQRLGGVALRVLVEVNMTGEVSKSGVTPADLPRLVEALVRCSHLKGVGLMTIARQGAPEAEARRTFAGLRDLLNSLQGNYPGDWTHLSMGMSDDYPHAIREGATMVRLGRALFGERL